MMQATIFYMEGCPYCRNAKRALEELVREKPEYAGAKVEWVNEEVYPERTNGYDYYYVPSIFIGKEKLYEAHPGDDYEKIRENVRAALEKAIS